MRIRSLKIALLAALVTAPAAASPVPIKFGTLAPEGSGWINTWNKIVQRIEKESPHPLKVLTYSGGVMGDEPDLVRKLKFDQLQIVGITVSGISQLVPEILVLGLPFMFRDYDEIDYVVKELMPTFQAIAEKKGLWLIAMLDQGMIELYSAAKVARPQELASQKTWTWNGNPLNILMDQAIGLSGTPVAVPELLPALQTGLVNAIFVSPAALVSFQWHTQIKYRVPTEVRYEPAAIIASARLTNKVPADKRDALIQVIDKAASDIMPGFLQELRRDEADMRKLLAESGVQTVRWSDADIAELKQKTQRVWAMAVEQGLFPQSLLDQVVASLAKYRQAKGGQP